ncbi:MAG TPA: LysR family transcriptional regulator [Candidatus Acidoferrum sp.]|nr:LysR family transcriptional regulator [Candidatus Acidoferrum sp.]
MWHIHIVNIREIDLNLLVGFEALIIERSVSGAARRIGLSQPAMSNLLTRLRKTFGDPLFERVGQRMAPTARARQLSAPIGDAMDVLRKAIGKRPPFVPARADIRYSIATTDYAEAVVLPSVLGAIKRQAPKVEFRITRLRAIYDTPVAELEVCDFALGLFRLPLPPGSGLMGTALFQERYVGIISKRHPIARQKFGLRQFLSLEHIRVNYIEEGPGLIGDAIQKIGHRQSVGLTVPHLVTVPFLTAQTEALGIVPLRLARVLGPPLGLRILELPIELPPLTMSLVWHERNQQDAAHRWFREFVPQNTLFH